MKIQKFAKMAESLRQYRRAELSEFESDIGDRPIDQLYVDPLPGNAILDSVLSSNTTFLLGRKGTGKSTVFARAQSDIRDRKDIISIYLDVKSLYDVLTTSDIQDQDISEFKISKTTYRAHILRKVLLGNVISELLKEINEVCEKLSLIDRWLGGRRQYEDLKKSLKDISRRVKDAKLESYELPILQKISRQIRLKNQQEKSVTNTAKDSLGAKIDIKNIEFSAGMEGSTSDFDKSLEDSDVYNEYSDIVLRSFPFVEIISEIKSILSESGLKRLVIFFDDFSELKLLDQRLFVDVVLAPLNNSSNESVKLKIAGYPGRVYYGRIDPSKTDTISLDFSDLYEAAEVQEMERSATNYTTRLLEARFNAFGLNVADYFDINSSSTLEEHMSTLFKASFNVPRIMGYLLHQCYLDRISKGQKITTGAVRLAARKYFENIVSRYFEKMNRFALEPFENKLDRNNQQQLLSHLVQEARTVRKKIIDGEVGGRYFVGLSNPQTSHFIVKPELEDVFLALETNFFLTRYKSTRDKEGNPVVVYAFFMGLIENERMSWGYPEGREYRNYFVQRCFDYTRAVHEYLSISQTIRCGECSSCFPMENKSSIALYKWKCPECGEGTCSIVSLSDDFREEVALLDQEIMLDPIELDIVTTIYEEGGEMRAGEIASLIDATHQLVGRRTSKLREMGLVKKVRDDDGAMRNSITKRCENTYFGDI
jgi:DNA-binding transcriptional ArsR family regulator